MTRETISLGTEQNRAPILTRKDLSTVPEVLSVSGPTGTIVWEGYFGFIHPFEVAILVLIW